MDRANFLPSCRRVERLSFLLERVRGRSVLHLGCAGGLLDGDAVAGYSTSEALRECLHRRLAVSARELCGIDLSPEKLEILRGLGVRGRLVAADLCDPSFPERVGGPYEVVVFANSIEHLVDPGSALRNCRAVMAPGSELLVTTNNAFDVGVLAKLLSRYESVHREHTAYYSYFTLKRLLEATGFEVDEFLFTFERRASFSGSIDRSVHHVARAVSRVLPQYSPGIAAVATPSS